MIEPLNEIGKYGGGTEPNEAFYDLDDNFIDD